MHRRFFLALGIVLALGTAARAEHYAFLVAVREYDPAELTSLRFTEKDITGLAKALEKAGYPRENIVLMTQTVGAERTRYLPIARNIMRELGLLLGELRESDTLVMAFSGHGVQFQGEKNVYFCPADAALRDRQTLISLTDVYRLLEQKCRASTKVMLVDACRNDPQSNVGKSVREVTLDPAGVSARPTPPGGVVVFFSCSQGEQSYEHSKLGHGVFLNFVIEALAGAGDLDKDDEVSLAELEQYAVSKVQKFARLELGRPQTPERKGEARGLLTLARLATGVAPKPELAKREEQTPVRTLDDSPLSPWNAFLSGLTGAADQFDATQLRSEAEAKSAQSRWATKLGKQVVERNTIGLELVLIPPGEFLMDTPMEYNDRKKNGQKQHRVRITLPLQMSKAELTQAQWEAVMGTQPWVGQTQFVSVARGSLKPEIGANYPACAITWYEAMEFCNKFSEREGLPAYYQFSNITRKENKIDSATVAIVGGKGYRLPTEAEWEYACRAGTTTAFSFGDMESQISAYAWWGADDRSENKAATRDPSIANARSAWHEKYAHTVATRKPNAFGLFDMHGNVREWCWDGEESSFGQNKYFDQFATTVAIDPQGPPNNTRQRLLRGGDFTDEAWNCRSNYHSRASCHAPLRFTTHGVRVVRSL